MTQEGAPAPIVLTPDDPAPPVAPAQVVKARSKLHRFFSLEWGPEKLPPLTAEQQDAMKVKWRVQRELRASSQPKAPEFVARVPDGDDNALVSALAEMVPGADGPKEKRNHLTLVELRYFLQNGKISAKAWEPISFLYMEAVKHRHLADFTFQRNYIESLLMGSRSVDGFGSDQLVRGMTGDAELRERNASRVQTPGPAEPAKKEAKRGIALR